MSSSKNLEFEKTSFLNKSNSAFIEQMYLKFINEDADLPESWKDYFEGIGDELNVIAKEINGPSWGPKKNKVNIDELQKKIDKEEDSNSEIVNANNTNINLSRSNEDSIKAVSMIRSYRQRGHLIAKLDPLGLLKSDYLDELHPESFGFKKEDYQKEADKLRKEVSKYQNDRRASLEKITTIRAKAKETLLNKINPILKKYSSENNISIILNSTSVLSGNSDSDITKLIVDQLNKEFPSIKLK